MHNKIETELETNIRYIESRFEGCADAVMRRILVGDEKLGMYVVYMDSMYDRDFIDGVVLKSLLFDRIQLPDQNAGHTRCTVLPASVSCTVSATCSKPCRRPTSAAPWSSACQARTPIPLIAKRRKSPFVYHVYLEKMM